MRVKELARGLALEHHAGEFRHCVGVSPLRSVAARVVGGATPISHASLHFQLPPPSAWEIRMLAMTRVLPLLLLSLAYAIVTPVAGLVSPATLVVPATTFQRDSPIVMGRGDKYVSPLA